MIALVGVKPDTIGRRTVRGGRLSGLAGVVKVMVSGKALTFPCWSRELTSA